MPFLISLGIRSMLQSEVGLMHRPYRTMLGKFVTLNSATRRMTPTFFVSCSVSLSLPLTSKLFAKLDN